MVSSSMAVSGVGLGSWRRPCVVLLLLLSFLHSTAAQLCTFWDGGCVDPLAQTAVSLDLPPLFLEDVNLYYAYDANSQGKGHGPMTKVSYWLRYARQINSSAIDTNRTSELSLRVGNLTGTPSGGHNGCDGIWGPRCSKDLQSLFSGAIYDLATKDDYTSSPLQAVLNKMQSSPPLLENCPPQFFDVQSAPVIRYAQESAPDKTATIQTSGSSTNPWKTWYIDRMTAKQQAEQVAVAIFTRSPSDDSPAPKSKKDIGIEFACLQAPTSGKSKKDDPDS